MKKIVFMDNTVHYSQVVAQRNPFERTFKRFLQIHLGEAKGEAIPSEPEGRIGIALEQALDVSKNVFGKRERIRANILFTVHRFPINCCACITIFIVLLIILSPLSCQADIFIKSLPDGSLQFSNCPIDSGWKTYIREKNHPPRQPNHITMDELDRVILDIAPAYNMDPSLIKSIIAVESEFSPNAMSQKGAIGLMQIMPETAFEMGIDDPWNPAQNITAGTKYLSILLKRYNGNLPLALAAYNAGPNMVQTYNGIPPFQETVEYVKEILKRTEK